MSDLSPRLKSLVDQTVTILGEVIRKEWGTPIYQGIEKMRLSMTDLRGKPFAYKQQMLRKCLEQLQGLSREERLRFACAYTLMLELMNACENAYRSVSIREKSIPASKDKPDSIIYVLTAHPTEARSPENIWIFHQIQICLIKILTGENTIFSPDDHSQLFHHISVAAKISIVRKRKPRVQDEAEHIYSTLLREETLNVLLQANASLAPVYIRTWVGGDKDGHPGVDKIVFTKSLAMSRRMLYQFVRAKLSTISEMVMSLPNSALVAAQWEKVRKSLDELKNLRPGDGKRIVKFRFAFREFLAIYTSEVGATHPALRELRTLMKIFPALVVPLEFRESSDVVMSYPRNKKIAIAGMIESLEQISEGTDPLWYVRGFIISMTNSFTHLQMAARLVEEKMGGLRIPIVPLFEQAEALRKSPQIVKSMINNKSFKDARKQLSQEHLEVMVGYSDSAKESGVLASRLEIAEAMGSLDQLCNRNRVTPLFFQGSGGSVDRGGGSIEEQTAWWPAGALRNYKVTIQGEMVERSLASPEISRRQLERIAASAGLWKQETTRKFNHSKQLKDFALRAATAYREKVQSPNFLQVIELATPYAFLNVLKIGSRPTKRTGSLSVSSLRAIPWVLCWTQTRVLFPVWWGIGIAWLQTNKTDKKKLKSDLKKDPVFSVFVRALRFTIPKIDLSVWSLYLEKSGLPKKLQTEVLSEFQAELLAVESFCREISGQTKEAKHWLLESIYLRSPMIHPLNLLQIIALREQDDALLRITVTGVSSGMMTTG